MTVIINDVHIDLRKPSANAIIRVLKLFANISANTAVIDDTIITIDLCLKHIISNEIIIYKKFEITNSLIQLFNKHQNLFIDQHQIIDILKKK